MKLLGDVSEEEKQLSFELEEMESYLDSRNKNSYADIMAQGYVCLAHDWYELNMEEEGHRLLEKAESVYPGYFKNLISVHTSKDKDFERLVKNISSQLAWMLNQKIGELKE